MAKKWSDVAASSAFQALSFEEQEEARRQYFEAVIAPQVPREDVSLARDQFFADTAVRRPAADTTPVDYGDAATAMQGGAPAEGRGLLQRIGDIFRPAPKTSVLDQPYTPTEQERQAEIDRRLSYGAGPVRPEMLATADALRSSRITGRRPEIDSPANAQRAVQIAREMDRRGERSSAEIIQDISRQGPKESELDSASRQNFAKENPLLGSLAAGSAGLISGAINIPSVTADAFNEIAVNPVLRALGMSELPRVPTAFGTEYLAKAAGDFMPKIGKQEMDVAIARDEFAPWLMSKLAANSPQIAQSLAAAFVPPLRAALLPGMAGTAAGQSFAQGDDSRVSLAKGGVEYVSEKLPLGVFDKVGDVLKNMSPVKANTVLAVAGQRALQAGGAITANTLTNAIEETAAQLGGNVLDKYFQGKEIELTKGLAEAAVVGGATGKLMSLPQATAAATGYYEPERQIAREIESAGGAFERLTPGDTQAIAIDMLRTERGTSDMISPAATVANFTPPDSATKRAGLVDIVVPVPGAEAAAPLGPINPTTEQQFGLDKLRMGGVNVGTSGVPGGLAGAGGEAGGGILGGGLDTAGLGAADATGIGGGIAGLPGVDDRSTVSAGGAAGQQPAGLTQPSKPLVWTGRAKTGYASEQDAEQAMATASTVIDTKQTHDWRVEPMGNGRFQLVGYQKETNLGTQTPQAQQTQAPGAAAPGQMAGATQGGATGIPAATGTPLKLSDSERAGLRLAPTAPVRELKSLNQQLDQQIGVTFSPVRSEDLTDSQRLASTVARLLGKTLTVVHQETGARMLPNGMIDRLGGKHLVVADNSDDAPLFLAVHEGYHGLPEDKRKTLNAALLEVFNQDQKGEFLREFSYNADNFDEEAPAMMAQAISKRADFWEDLRTKMGNKEFGEVAKVILTKLGDIITGAKKQYGEDFVNKYITDIARARDLLSTAYAEAMQAQGLKPDVELTGGVMASSRAAADGQSFLKASGFNEFGPAEGEWVKPVSKLGDVIAKVVSAPGEPVRMEISADYMGRRFGTKVAEGEPAIKAAIEWASSGIQRGREKLAARFMAEERGLPGGPQTPMLTASNRSRLDLNFKDVIKRTPELQAAAAKVQAGEMTAAEYDKLVNETKPVEPYTSVPQPASDNEIRTALTSDKVERIGVPSRTLKAGDPVGLRLDIPAYSNHGTWVVSVHQQEAGYNAGKSIGYEPVAAATNVTFGVVEKAAMNIAAGKPKATIAVIKGGWKPTTPAEAKLKADQALKSKDWVQVGMDPERHSYFYDRATMEPVTAADEVIQIGPLVLAKNPTYGEKSGFMFSNKARTPVKLADYKPQTDNFNKQRDMARMLSEAVPAETVAKADEFVERYYKERQPVAVSPEDRLKAEILLRPKMKAAEQVKPEYDQKILDISARTGALGQMLAPIKGVKRAAEKLAIEENFEVDNIKDLLRSTIVVESYADALPIVEEIRKEFDVVRIKDRAEAGVMGEKVTAEPREKSGGYGDILINIRMPNGTVGEIQINTPAMLAAKDGQGHKLYEAAREQPEGSPLRQEIYGAMRVLYDAAFEAANLRAPSAQARNLASEIGAPRAGSDLTATSSSPESASLKTLPSGKATNSSPENEATNSLPGGKEAGTFIEGSPDKASVSQQLSGPKPVGRYTYTTDAKGRIIVAGDAKRIKFLTKKIANGVVIDGGVRFNAEDAKAVFKALKDEPAANAEIARAVAEQLGLTPQELASTSLEYQTGLPKDKAFVAPILQGIPEVVQFLEQRRRTSGLRMLDIAKPEDQEVLSRLIAAETLAAIRSSGNALQWYDETIARTLAMAAVKYPELAKDANAQMVFRLAMAITSQGLNVESNLKFTMRQYDAYRRTGRYPEVGEGDSSQAMVSNFKLANELMDEMGPDLFRRFLVTPFTIGELNSAGFEPGGELVDEMVLGSSVFGPKIGFGFYSNLNGNFEPVTMDMWFMRTIGRLIGALRLFDAEKFGRQAERFRSAFDERGSDGIYADRFDQALVDKARTDDEAAIALARLVKSAHEKDFKNNRAAYDAGNRAKSKLVYAADTMIQSVDKPKDVPASGMERRQLREVVRKAVAEVEGAYGQRVPPAAMQALIWYPEQELYKAMGVKLSVTSQDYAGATEKVLTEEGYDAKQLRSAAESGARGVRQANARDVGRAAQGTGQRARQSGPLQTGERADFLRARYERTELAKERLEPKRKGVIFEVAPDPNNEALTNAWRALSQEQRVAISERVAREIVPRVLSQFDTDGIISPQVGSYLDDTNPSFSLLLNKGDVLDVSRALGFVLAQDSMMVISPKPFKGGSQVGAIFVNVGEKSSSEIDGIYQKLREIRVKGDQPVGGQSYANGRMIILNYSDVSTDQLAILIDQKLNKSYSVETGDVYSAFPEKKEYDYASEKADPRGGRADLRRRARELRAEATSALEAELRNEGVQFSQRARPDAAGGGRDRGVGQEDVRGQGAPSYGTPREGAASAVGYHYSTQPRGALSSVMYGTGLRGAEMQRLEGADSRLRQRVYFYIDRGTGITPEAGVGGYAHRVNLQNLYDADEDALRLQRDAANFNAFESAVIDAGFDGYMVRQAGPSGNAVLLGQHAVPVEQLGSAGRMQTSDVVPAARDRVLTDSEKIAANKSLPSGQVTGQQWAKMIKAMMPDVYERLADSPVWQSDKAMYRSELAKELRASASAPTFSNRALPKVSPQSALDRDIADGAQSLAKAMNDVRAGKSVSKIVIGRLPHVLNMLGARTQDFAIASSIVQKIFDGKHRDEFPDVKPIELVRALYRPAMIFRDKGGSAREYELVLPITNKNGAMLVPIKVSVEAKQDPFGAVMSAYNKRISTDSAKPKEMTLMRRIQEGNLLYVDPMLAKQAITGRERGADRDGVKLNDKFLSWQGVWPTIEKLIQDRRAKTDVDLMKWIGDNYKPESSAAGMADAPAFSKRARTDTPEFKRWFGDSKVVDKNGQPLVVYHATNSRDISKFRMGANEGGAWFAADPEVAEYFGEAALYPVYLSIQNPLPDGKDGDKILSDAEKRWPGKTNGELLRLLGYDGLSFNELDPDRPRGAKGTTWMVVSPEQIKSAIGNSGAFDPNDPDIRFSNRAAKPELDKDVVSLFKDLQDSRGLGRIRVQERVDAHPMAETIRRVDNEFMDILERLDDAGLVKINCK